ncbi:ribonuclease E/G [Plastoroseomonas arctica]|uniref:Ribonuclease n=1 Tax=Plastoroseomonas arctica TaxID=1509237 RepID=A0AAF1JWE2_9PROT|nr:ribonuclease E/G [Plastoroseomonas arctica]MBR0655087.1 ribonuclease [Plastoroseomonas arctica]
MKREILVAAAPGEHRIALLEDGRAAEFRIHRPHGPDGVGDLVLARILTHAAPLAGSFCALPDGATGFLPDSEAKHLDKNARSEGMLLPLRITRAAQGSKGPRLTARVSEEEARLNGPSPALLWRAPHLALRLAARHQAPIRTDSRALAASLRAGFSETPVFDDAIETAFEEACTPTVALPGGASISIHPTPALVAIDIDSGPLGPAVNAAALETVARQIRLRDLAGAILIDPAGLPAKQRAALAPGFAAALDPLARLVGLTGLGLIEVQRARIHPPLYEAMTGPLALALAALRKAAREARHRPGARLTLHAAPRVVDALQANPVLLEDYTAETGAALTLVADKHETRFSIG